MQEAQQGYKAHMQYPQSEGELLPAWGLFWIIKKLLHSRTCDFHFSGEVLWKTQRCVHSGLLVWNFCWEFPTMWVHMRAACLQLQAQLSGYKQVGLTQVHGLFSTKLLVNRYLQGERRRPQKCFVLVCESYCRSIRSSFEEDVLLPKH